MKNILKKSIEIITDQFEEFHSYYIYIIDYLSSVIYIDASLLTENNKKCLLLAFKNLCTKYPDSTHLISSIYHFIRNSLRYKDFAQRIMSGKSISFFIDQGIKEKRTSASANALLFLDDLEEMRKSSSMISKSLSSNTKYIEFYNNFFKKYLEELQTPYKDFKIIKSK